MQLLDEEDIKKERSPDNSKIRKLIIASIIILIILCIAIVSLIVYRIENPTKITTKVNGTVVDGKGLTDFGEIIDIQKDENGETEIYIPIRDFASYLNLADETYGYETFKGDYSPKTEEEDKCYVIRDKYEVAIYTEKSKIIYKLNLQKGDSSEDYEESHIDKDVFLSNGKLYTSIDGIEKGYNVYFSYDEKKKVVDIYTLDYLIEAHKKNLATYGLEIDEKDYWNCKSIFEELLIVEATNKKFGILKGDYSEYILEPQYDNISYISDSQTFLVESDKKIGLFSKDGKRKIDLTYDEITSMGQESNLYIVKSNGQYGVVDENGKTIIYPEHEKIGIDISSFSYNGVKNGYILLNQLIPVQDDKKWAFYDITGKQITDSIYENVGCTKVKKGNNIHGLLQIPEYDVLVVGDEYDKYWFMDTSGNDEILPHVLDQIYIKITSGEISYWMALDDREDEVLKYLKQLK